MNWDDLRFVVAVARQGSLIAASKALKVEHTTVGRRITAAEQALSTKLFSRTTRGLVLTAEGERLLESMQHVEDAVKAVERRASADSSALKGSVRVTAPETFGIAWLAPRLAQLSRQAPELSVELDPSGVVKDLGGREAEVAVRFFRTRQQGLVVRKVAEVAYGLYAATSLLAREPVRSARDLTRLPLLSAAPGDLETRWLEALAPNRTPVFSSPVTLALVGAAKAGAGVAVLPRYLGDEEPELHHLPMPDEPKESVWLTVHADLRTTPRVRAVLDFLAERFAHEAAALSGVPRSTRARPWPKR